MALRGRVWDAEWRPFFILGKGGKDILTIIEHLPYSDLKSLSHLDLAYATTIHKSQGGQYDSVLLSIQNCHGRMLKRPLVYTGLTRARCRAQIVGDWQAVIRAIQTTDTERRNTLLAARIIQTAT